MATLCFGLAAWAAYSAVRSSQARSWPAVPCEIIRSTVEVNRGDAPYRFRVTYGYTWAGRSYAGWKYGEGESSFADIAEADRLARAFPEDSHAVCYVNPRDPSDALLRPSNPWTLAGIAAVLLLGGASFVLKGPEAGMAWGGFLAILGAAIYAVAFGPALTRGVDSLGWRPTPCVVRSGQVRSRGTRPPTHWPDVTYCYQVDGVPYRANTVNASDMGSPWYYGARGVVRRHPPGMVTTCYVNPSDPSEAVLVRGLSGTQWFGVWPLGMAVWGASLVFRSITGREFEVVTSDRWVTPAAGVATASALTALWATGADLLRDRREGLAEWPEYAVVAVAGILSAGLVILWVGIAAENSGGKDQSKTSTGWDREIDRLPRTKGGSD
jgi:hypothetical protein